MNETITIRVQKVKKNSIKTRLIFFLILAAILLLVTIFADKISVDEEVVRLKSHIDTMAKTIENGGHIGRKLDFIAQEMNREANTTLSKANDLATSDVAIDLKTSIEKIREQIQNIE